MYSFWSLQLWQLRVVSGYWPNMGYLKMSAELVCLPAWSLSVVPSLRETNNQEMKTIYP